MNLLCRLGVHSFVEEPRPGAPAGRTVCRRCGTHVHGLLAPDLTPWWGGTSGITVGELRAALEGVPDEVEVEVESNSIFGWAGADSAYLAEKRTALATDDPQTVPVFRVAGGEHGHGTGGAPPGMGG